MSATEHHTADEPGKLRSFLSILRKFIGVADIATVRFSLPAQLLEPTPNLEFWTYMDRPETFVSIGKSDDDLGRTLEVLRFWFTKDIKYITGKPCKPYNSVLGEFFRCNWEVEDSEPSMSTLPGHADVKTVNGDSGEQMRISFLCEQTSHHPPVSAFYIDCPQRGLIARGFDQISAKFTGTSVRISPGQHNLGIFITLKQWDDEEYQLTHPAANVNGFLRGALWVSVTDTCYVACPKTRIKTILQYLEDGWLSRAQHRVIGVTFRYDPDNDVYTSIKDVPEQDVLIRIEGSWQNKVYYTLGNNSSNNSTNSNSNNSNSGSANSTERRQQLVELAPLHPIPKIIPPEESQLPNESRRFWGPVTEAIRSKQYSLATSLKHDLEERQRTKAALRSEKNEVWKPRFFTLPINPSGKPELTDDGRRALDGLHERNYFLEESKVYGA